ncbi:hypothetical protein BCD48_25115 [Pseudofrankia sp. BMG5.36]|nr:hypothetical protein BCD48_25115 [Pseudofrankia sp. BMG5.36]
MIEESGASPPGSGRPRPNTSRRQLVEEKIYDAAARRFATRGFAGTNLTDIAEDVGVTRQALYHYVANKEALLARLADAAIHATAAALDTAAATPTGPAAGLRRLAHLLVLASIEHAYLYRAVALSAHHLAADEAAAYADARRAVHDRIGALLAEGVRDGVFLPLDEQVAAHGIEHLVTAPAWWSEPGCGVQPHLAAEQIAAMALRGVARGGGDATARGGPSWAIARLRTDLDYLERSLRLPSAAPPDGE